jgi:hypothetical protein
MGEPGWYECESNKSSSQFNTTGGTIGIIFAGLFLLMITVVVSAFSAARKRMSATLTLLDDFNARDRGRLTWKLLSVSVPVAHYHHHHHHDDHHHHHHHRQTKHVLRIEVVR